MFLDALPMEFLPNSKTKQEKIQKIYHDLQSAHHVLIIGPGLKELSVKDIDGEFSHILYIDGGAKWAIDPLLKSFSDHSIIIGDKDSYAELRTQPNIDFDFTLPMEKNESDLSFGLKLLSPKVRKLTLIGFSGGRFDHELSNLGVLDEFLNYAHSDAAIEITIDEYVKIFSRGYKSFHHHGLFSLFSLTKQSITIQGDVKYPLTDKTTFYPLQSLGLSNEATGTVEIESEANVFVIFPQKDQRHKLF